jgi:hypothetical protein
MTLVTFRDALASRLPQWLQRGVAQKLMYAIGVQLDGAGDAAVAAVKHRFPGLYSMQTLPMIGRDRRIRRGRIEVDEVYASRLRRWLDDHRGRGGPYALLKQLHAHFAPANFPTALVYYSGRRWLMDAAGVIARADMSWLPDTVSANWPRWWLFYEWPDGVTSDGVWGDPGEWSDGGVWGSTLTVQDVTDLRAVPREWNAAHADGTVVLLPDGAELWGYPPGPWSDPGVWNGGLLSPVIVRV